MKRRIAFAAASIFALSAMAGPALAGEGMKGAGGSAADTTMPGAATGENASPGMPGDRDASGSVTGETTGAIGGAHDLSSAMSAIGTDSSAQIGAISEVSSVNVVQLDSLTGEDGTSAELQSAVSENADNIASLQAAIDANQALKSELESQNVEPADVVAARTEADGSVTVFVQ